MSVRASIAMAVYNGEKYIKEQIDSILKMMAENDELVISYNVSTDRTLDIIKEYENLDNRVHIVYDDGHSVESNFNNAVKNCFGKYIFLADQDDVWINDKINKMCAILEKNPKISVLIGNGYFTSSTLENTADMFKSLKTTANPILNFIKGTYLGCQMAFTNQLKYLVWPVKVSPPLPHDLWLGVFGSLYGKLELFDDYTILHRLHEENFSNTSKMSLWGVIKNRSLFLVSIISRFFLNKKRGN